MTPRTGRSFLALILTLSALGACSVFEDKNDRPPLPGERLSVLELQKSLEPDNTMLEAQGLITPPEWKNEFWPQAGGYPNHSMQNLALAPDGLKRVWSADIGKGSTDKLPLTAQPILFDGKIFTLDTHAELSAFDAETGQKLWKKNIGNADEDDPVITGGLAFSNGILVATNGFSEVLAITPNDSAIIWRKNLPAPSRAAPTVLNGRVFVTTLDNKILALAASDGSVLWEYRGIAEAAGLIGAASPAANNDIVIPAFSSGEISALRVANGSLTWTDNLSNTRGLGGLSTISDIKALPIIDKGLIIAISFSGRMVAIDERTGIRVWQREISSSQTPWVAGNHIFVLSSENQLIALGRETGSIRWVTELPRIDDGEVLTFTGPVLAGGRLIVAGTNGIIIEVNPETGDIINDWDAGATITIPPIVAGGTLYILSEN
ncbi:MAG: PQQ-binding-like beta-propeller repeat protein, partial [Bdellovibrionales bacterium]